jgi:D-glycero-alpha-D-manno-heptose-7-phosphate kinase
VLAAHGGINHITFLPNGDFAVRPVTIPHERVAALGAHLMLFYTRIPRTASEVADTYVNALDEGKRRQLRMCRDLVEEGISVLQSSEDLTAFGELLHEGWEAKRSLSARVSTHEIDAAYEVARRNGAIGGKLTGAGGGGFMLLFVPPERQPSVRAALSLLLPVPFSFEFSGSQIIFFTPEREYAREVTSLSLAPETASVA